MKKSQLIAAAGLALVVGFCGGLLVSGLPVHAQASKATDESSAVELLGYQPRIVQGRADNIKVTVAEDLLLAEHILKARAS